VHGRDLWPVKVDISQFEQVVVNLAVNARDAMPDGGKLTVRTANVEAKDTGSLGAKGMPSGDYVMVEVSDTGTGIPPDIIDKIFEPFFTTNRPAASSTPTRSRAAPRSAFSCRAM
jgi:two-component system cell cycle sensor histidine kinase/response regulator CckA